MSLVRARPGEPLIQVATSYIVGRMRHTLKISVLLIFGLALLSCSSGGDDEPKLSTNSCSLLGLPTRSIRIINGAACGSLTSSPVVRIYLLSSAGADLGFCSGSMITSSIVLTAAHCFVNSPASVVIVYGDATDSTSVPARSYNLHPAYIPATSNTVPFNDVALVQLSQALPLPTLPVFLSSALVPGQIASIFGYGKDENGLFDGAQLEGGEMRISGVTENHINAEFDGEGSNTCNGDSGGPLVINAATGPALIGLTSAGSNPSCLAKDTSIFTNLQSQSILDFLTEAVPEIEIS